MSRLDTLTVDHFAGHRAPAWMGLGTAFDHDVTDLEDMLTISGLGNVEYTEHALTVDGIPGAEFLVPVKALCKTENGTTTVLGTVGESRPLIHPREAFAFLQSLNDGARWTTAGDVRGGRTIFGQIEWERETVLDPNGVSDRTAMHLLCAYALDGTLALQGGVTPTRAECQNTLNIALKDASQTFKIRQTKNARERMAIQAELWREANHYADAFDVAAKALFEKEFSDKQFENAFLKFYPKPDAANVKGALTKWEDQRDSHFAMWNAEHNAGIRGTAWGAANVLTEVNQWGRGIRSGDKGREAFALAGAGFDTATNNFRSEAFALVAQRAGVTI